MNRIANGFKKKCFPINILQPDKPRVVAVLDIVKTTSKFCLMDGQTWCIYCTLRNARMLLLDAQPPYPHIDEGSNLHWITRHLFARAWHNAIFITSNSITTHGANDCLYGDGDKLALPNF